jgi:hypothetical protein
MASERLPRGEPQATSPEARTCASFPSSWSRIFLAQPEPYPAETRQYVEDQMKLKVAIVAVAAETRLLRHKGMCSLPLGVSHGRVRTANSGSANRSQNEDVINRE